MNTIKVSLDLPVEKLKAISDAIALETEGELMQRSQVLITSQEGKITVNISAKDLNALRASLNTYMRMIIMCSEIIEVN
jgi:tRNA threonylcarbamoyladenosine modification (KEOPS) complex  Pcc1 subunit